MATIDISDGFKFCNGCNTKKELSCFGIERNAKNGYKPRCKECTNAYDRDYHKKNRSRKSERDRKYFLANKEKVFITKKKYRENNQKRINANYVEYVKKRKLADEEYRHYQNTRSRITTAFKKNLPSLKKIVGYTRSELILYLGGEIEKGFTIDHKIPISWFNTYTEPIISFDLRNCQILSISENSSKRNLYADPVSKDYYDVAISHIKEEYKNKVIIKTSQTEHSA
jgi:hypothetical protein